LNDKKNKNVSPIYAVALLWLFWGLLIPLVTVGRYIPLIVVAAILYKTVNNFVNAGKELKNKKREKKEPRAEKPREKKSTGNPRVDALIEQRDDFVAQMRRLNLKIDDEKISAQINDMEYTTSKIYDYVIAHPEMAGQINQFQNYYLPTTIKLLSTYERLSTQGISGENISGTMEKVKDTLDKVVEAFHKQLDTLFAGEALDVSADITVMENLMKSEGLSDDGDQLKLQL
jgi:5-bromo-4-chloroindolyl phosphate hydrolysis protein